MNYRKLITTIITVAMVVTSSFVVSAAGPRTGASAIINLETKEYCIPGDVLNPGQVIQMNIGNGTGNCGYRFVGVNAYLGTGKCIVLEKSNMTCPETVTAPVSQQIEKLKNTTGHELHSKEFRELMVTQWVFNGFAEDGFAEFYGVWDNYKAASDASRDRSKEAKKNEDHEHTYGGDPVIKEQSTMTSAGVQSRYCTRWYCDAEDSGPITYDGYMKDIANLIKFAPDNAVITAENPSFLSPADYVIKALNERPDVTLILNKDKNYKVNVQ